MSVAEMLDDLESLYDLYNLYKSYKKLKSISRRRRSHQENSSESEASETEASEKDQHQEVIHETNTKRTKRKRGNKLSRLDKPHYKKKPADFKSRKINSNLRNFEIERESISPEILKKSKTNNCNEDDETCKDTIFVNLVAAKLLIMSQDKKELVKKQIMDILLS